MLQFQGQYTSVVKYIQLSTEESKLGLREDTHILVIYSKQRKKES